MLIKAKIPVKMYDCELTVILTDGSINKIYKGLIKKYDETHEIGNEPGGLSFSPDKDISQYFIMLPVTEGRVCIGTLTHELDHIKNYILEHRQIKYTTQDDESGAYLIGHLMAAVYGLMVKKKIEFYTK